jgi:hypothetical protein
MHNSTDITERILEPLAQEIESINYEWVAFETFSDILCVAAALYVLVPGLKKLWPYHKGYDGARKGFMWLAARWGVGNYPHIFRTFAGLVEVAVAAGCMLCFLPGPTAQVITCLSLYSFLLLCLSFVVTHWKDTWAQILGIVKYFVIGAVALSARLWQDFPFADEDLVTGGAVVAAVVGVGFLYMLYRRFRFGKVPDPLLG